jgi:hypothetical protein
MDLGERLLGGIFEESSTRTSKSDSLPGQFPGGDGENLQVSGIRA